MTRMIALLRGINVGGNKKVPMLHLRELAEKLGLRRVETYIQSGNLVFETDLAQDAVEAALAKAIEKKFNFPVEVVTRSATEWESYAAGSPFADAERERPKFLALGLAKRPLKTGAADALKPYATAGERVVALSNALWIDYFAAVGSSKLTPAVIDRAAGSTVTARNWRTVQTIAEMLRTSK